MKAKTGQPALVVRGDVELCIVRKDSIASAKRSSPRVLGDLIVGEPDDLVHVEWPWSQGRGRIRATPSAPPARR